MKAAHANGASLMFAALYAHVFRGVYYRAYAPPRRAVWLVGSAMFLAVCAVGFLGGVLS